MQKEYYDEFLEKYDVEDRYLNLFSFGEGLIFKMKLIQENNNARR